MEDKSIDPYTGTIKVTIQGISNVRGREPESQEGTISPYYWETLKEVFDRAVAGENPPEQKAPEPKHRHTVSNTFSDCWIFGIIALIFILSAWGITKAACNYFWPAPVVVEVVEAPAIAPEPVEVPVSVPVVAPDAPKIVLWYNAQAQALGLKPIKLVVAPGKVVEFGFEDDGYVRWRQVEK